MKKMKKIEVRSWYFVDFHKEFYLRDHNVSVSFTDGKYYISEEDIAWLAKTYDVMLKDIEDEVIVFLDVKGCSFRQR